MAGLYIANKIKKQIKSEQEIQGTKAELLSLDPFVFTDTLELLSNYLQEIQKSIYNIQNNNVPDPILLSSPHSLPIWMTYLPKNSTGNEREGKQKITQPQGVKKNVLRRREQKQRSKFSPWCGGKRDWRKKNVRKPLISTFLHFKGRQNRIGTHS